MVLCHWELQAVLDLLLYPRPILLTLCLWRIGRQSVGVGYRNHILIQSITITAL